MAKYIRGAANIIETVNLIFKVLISFSLACFSASTVAFSSSIGAYPAVLMTSLILSAETIELSN